MPFPASDLYPQASGLYPGDGTEGIPTVTTGGATPVDSTHETLAGIVNPNGLETHYYFQYGLTEGYGSQTSTGDAGSGVAPVAITRTATPLLGGRYYHYRLVAYSTAGFAYGEDATFVTELGRDDPRTDLVQTAGWSQ